MFHKSKGGKKTSICLAADTDVWAGSLAGAVEEVHIAETSPEKEPLKGLKSQVDAAWEYQAKKRRKSVDERQQQKDEPQGYSSTSLLPP